MRATARNGLAVIVAAVDITLAVWGVIRLIGVDLIFGADNPEMVGAVASERQSTRHRAISTEPSSSS